MPESPAAILEQLGLTALESEIYVFLTHSSPATGYRIAKAISKPTANTYKALESLASKGMILCDDGQVRQFRAVSYADVLQVLDERHRSLREQAARALKQLERSSQDDRVYQVETPEQVFVGFRRMLKSARRVALFDVFPGPLEHIAQDLEKAARRGVQVYAKIYSPTEIAGVDLIMHDLPEFTLSRWPGQWINGVVDGQEYQIAFLSHDLSRVHQAIWSASVCLSWIYHHGLASEYAQTVVGTALQNGTKPRELINLFEKYSRLMAIDAPGHDELMRRFQAGAKPVNAIQNAKGKRSIP